MLTENLGNVGQLPSSLGDGNPSAQIGYIAYLRNAAHLPKRFSTQSNESMGKGYRLAHSLAETPIIGRPLSDVSLPSVGVIEDVP